VVEQVVSERDGVGCRGMVHLAASYLDESFVQENLALNMWPSVVNRGELAPWLDQLEVLYDPSRHRQVVRSSSMVLLHDYR
jgi:hypothetical protein